jgi:hypothetical protein
MHLTLTPGTCHDVRQNRDPQPGWLEKKSFWSVKWPLQVSPPEHVVESGPGFGRELRGDSIMGYAALECWPIFYSPTSGNRIWYQKVAHQMIITTTTDCACQIESTRDFSAPSPSNSDCPPCAPIAPPPPSTQCPSGGWNWQTSTCCWNCNPGTPIIIDLDNDNYNLTDAANGVMFDLRATGTPQRWSWTAGGSDDAFLALDRDNNGRIDSGKELFGNFTDQPISEEPNGFIALAMFDNNNDRWIDRNDAVFDRLVLWVDLNHDGISQSSELHLLNWGGVEGISLDYKESKRTDQHGNHFKYRAKVRGAQVGRWAWDVFLLSQ